jgi:hypothetical protein
MMMKIKYILAEKISNILTYENNSDGVYQPHQQKYKRKKHKCLKFTFIHIELHIPTKIANKYIPYTRVSIIINWHPHNQQQKYKF